MLQLLSCGLDQLEYPQQIGNTAVTIHASVCYYISYQLQYVKVIKVKLDSIDR